MLSSLERKLTLVLRYDRMASSQRGQAERNEQNEQAA